MRLADDGGFYQFRTWVDHLVGDTSAQEVRLRALGFSVGIFGLGFAIAVAGRFGAAYLQSASVYLVAVGLLLTFLSYAWASRKFLSLWPRIRNAFAASDDVDEPHVWKGLDRVYNDKAIFSEFGLAAVAILSSLSCRFLPRFESVGLRRAM